MSTITQLEMELESTRDELRRAVQDLKSAEEGHRSTLRELAQSRLEERKTRDTLQVTNDFLRNLLTSTRIAAIFLDADLRILNFSMTASEIYHLEEKDIGRPLSHFAHRAVHMPALPSVEEVANPDAIAEHEIKTHDDRIFLRRAFPFRDHEDRVKGIVLTFSDVTRLRRSEERIRLLLDSTAEAIYGLSPAGKCTFCNSACARLLGYEEPKELIGELMHRLIHRAREDGGPYPLEETPVFDTLRHGKRVHVDSEILWRKDGACFPAEYWAHPIIENGQTTGAVVTFVNISRRQQSEKALREAKQRLTQILDSISDGFISLDRDWNCTYVNRPAARMLRRQETDLLGENFWRVLPELKPTPFCEELARCMSSGENALFEVFLKSHDAWYECHCYPSRDVLSVYFTDITQWKHEQLLAEKTGERIERAISESQGGFWDMELDSEQVPPMLPEECYFSPRLKTLLGYEAEELPDKLSAWLERVHPEDRTLLQQAMVDHLRGISPRFECEYRVQDTRRNYLWFQSRGNVVRDARDRPLRWTAVTLDISEKKREEEHQATLAAIIDSSQDGIIGQSLDGTILSWNPGATRMYGYEADEVLGKTVFGLIVPQDRFAELQEAMHRIGNGELIQPFETLRLARDGRPLDVLLTLSPIKNRFGRIIGLSAIHSDITQKRRMEARMRQLNRTLSAVLRVFPDIVWVVSRDNELQFLNPAAEKFLKTRGPDRELPPEIQNEIQRALETGDDYLPTDFRGVHCLRMNGEDRYYLCRLVAMKDGKGDLFGLTVMLQDVTDFRMLDEIKTSLIGTVSHELKTPVTSVRMSLLLLLEEQLGKLNERQRELAAAGRDEIERLLRTLNTLLDITRFEEGRQTINPQPVAVEKLIETAIDEVRAAAEAANIALQLELEPELPTIEVDFDRIVHVLTNFLTNAIKHAPNGSTIRIQARKKDPQHVCFGVIDRGPGIPRDQQQRVFEKFFKLPGNTKHGTGLGLAIAREFVRAHKGIVGVSSTPPHGSEFYMVLPIKPPK